MTGLEVEHLGGRRVRIALDGAAVPVEFDDPFTAEAAETLRWLLEDCPDLPFGPERQRWKDALNTVEEMGEALWNALTPTEDSQAVMRTLAERHSDITRVRVISDDPRFLGIPWELIRLPGTGDYPLVLVREFTRCRRTRDGAHAATVPRQAESLRILLVSPRPYGNQDVRPRTVRGPILEAAARSQGVVRVDLLRPPTLRRFKEVMASSSEYDIVHFDGHGFFEEGATGISSGVLFEREDGGPDRVLSTEFAGAVPAGTVPMIVLNACRSAKAAPGTTVGSVAMALLDRGVPAVLGMTHNVGASQVSSFSRAFYDAMAEGRSVAVAASIARRVLLREADGEEGDDRDKEEKARVRRPFHALPVLYSVDTWTPAFPHVIPDAPATVLEGDDGEDLRALMYRDDELTTLDRLLMEPDPVVVHGVVGGGKTRFLHTYRRYNELINAFDEIRPIWSEDLARDPSLPLRAAQAARARPERSVLHVWDGVDGASFAKVEEAARMLPGGHRVLIATRHDAFTSRHRSHALGDMGTEVTGWLIGRMLQDRPEIRRPDPYIAGLPSWLPRASGWHAASVRAMGRALEGRAIDEVCWSMEIGFPAGEDDPLLDPEVVRCLEGAQGAGEVERRRLELIPFIGLCGHTALPGLLGLVTDRGLQRDPFAELMGIRVPRAEWEQVLLLAETMGLIQRFHKSPALGFSVPPAVSFALRGALARRFSRDELGSLRLAVAEATYGMMVTIVPEPEKADTNGYAWRRQRNFFMDMLESSVWVALLNALDLGEYEVAAKIAAEYAREPPGSFGWWRAWGMLDDLCDYTRPAHGGRVEAAAFFGAADDILSWAAAQRRDWPTAKTHLERLIGPPPTAYTEPRLLPLLLRGARVMLHTDGVAEARRLLTLAVDRARAQGTPGAVAECRSTWQQLVDDMALAPTEAGRLAAEVGLPPPNADEERPVTYSQMSRAELLTELREAELQDSPARIVGLRRYLGERARNAGDLDEARGWLRSALALGMRNPLVGEVAWTAHELSMVEEQDDNLDDAAHWCLFAIERARERGAGRTEADAHHELGIIEMKRERHAEAAAAFEVALRYYRRNHMPDYADDTEFLMAVIDVQRGEREEGVRACRRLVERFDRAGSHAMLVRACLFISEDALGHDENEIAAEYLGRARRAMEHVDAPDREDMREAVSAMEQEL
ncbi:CHAT domain-containing protein [Sphaerisporangium dianthi]|uniref:CHAT domain-containing protein n=1 Tax=Sphaerisporangium dianthi TaxID=1436120 RepID=A0ABV9CBW4_9ACTN